MSAETTPRPLQAGDRVLIAEHLVPAFDGQTHGTVVEVAGTRYQYVLVDVAGRVYWFASTDLTLDPTSPSDGAVTSTPAPSDDTNALVELDRQEATPRERAMAALAEQEHIPWAGHRLPENWDEHADAALSAAADLPGLAAVAARHHMKGGAGNPTCVCDWTPDWTAGPWIPQFDLHLASEIRAYLTGGAS